MSHSPNRPGRITLRPVSSSPAVGFPLPCSAPKADTRVTLARWLDIWMSTAVEPCRADTTIGGYSNIIQKHLIPALGAVRLTDLSPALIAGYYRWLEDEKGLSPNTVRKHHVLLHTALKAAYQQGILSDNPVMRVTPPSPSVTNIKYYTPAQLSRLLAEVANLPLELPVKLACYLGLRRSEVLGLRWRDVDLEEKMLSIRRVRTTVGYRVVEKPPKTEDSRRTMSIAALADLLSLLHQLVICRAGQRLPCGPDDFLVLDEHHQPWHPNTLSTALTTFLKAKMLPPITFHGLRHTFASMANSARVPMYQISRAMGHSNPNITQRIYTHLFDQTHGEVLAAVADTISRGGMA